MPNVFTSPTALKNHQKKRFAKMQLGQQRVHKELATQGERDFVGATGGQIKSKTLAAMGHPFGRMSSGGMRNIVKGQSGKFGSAGLKGQVSKKGVVRPLPINVQSGRLRRAITLQGPAGRASTYKLYSAAPHARFVLSPTGTKKMVARGLLGGNGLLRKRHKARLAALVSVIRAQQKQ